LDELHVLVREAEENAEGMCAEAVALGRALAAQIRTEAGFPPDYLENVETKSSLLSDGLNRVERDTEAVARRLAYLRGKRDYRKRVGQLWQEVLQAEKWTKEKRPQPSEADVRRAAELRLRLAPEVALDLKRKAGQLALHAVAPEDEDLGGVKDDAYQLCDRFEAVAAELAEVEERLAAALREERAKPKMSAVEEQLSVRLDGPAYVSDEAGMKAELDSLRRFVPRMDIGPEVRGRLEKRIEAHKADMKAVADLKQEMEGIFVWMREVSAFLSAEDPAVGDAETLEAQIKESDALQEDVATLRPSVDAITKTGARLKERSDPKLADEIFGRPLNDLKAKWEETVAAAREQNGRLKLCREQSEGAEEALDAAEVFLRGVEADLPEDEPTKETSKISQRTFKLQELRERMERKRTTLSTLLDASHTVRT